MFCMGCINRFTPGTRAKTSSSREAPLRILATARVANSNDSSLQARIWTPGDSEPGRRLAAFGRKNVCSDL
jgi:hypothetical protein